MMSAILDSFPNAPNTVGVCLGSLQETTVSSEDVVHTILRGTVEFFNYIRTHSFFSHDIQISKLLTSRGKDNWIIRTRRIRQAKNLC